LALCLLAGLFLLAVTESQAEVAPSPPDLVAAFQAAARRCPACGAGELEVLWEAKRPSARELERLWDWERS
jgi:hypothetical protein